MTETRTETTAAPSGARRAADVVFAYLCALLVLGLFAQIFLAGFGVFDLHGRDLDSADSFDAHEALGHILGGVALLMLIAAIVSRTSKFAIWASLALVVLIEFAQSALASGGDDHAWVGGLHALDGGAILVIALVLHLRSRGAFSRSG
jgi:Mn2+/Fe2+ NRAMP family transporter